MNRLEQLQPRERRILAVGVLVALVLIALLGGVVPIVQKLASTAESVASAGFRLERVQEAAAQLPIVEAEVSAPRKGARRSGADPAGNERVPRHGGPSGACNGHHLGKRR